ncbi:MAG: tRNA threonylcarbamoyladenosine dehydratase [Zoogloeaceae bacterium]|jgi:tRNA A37 threonylcarbamoyladenosine dehydratase|nr:tRNA threonylcarbamoyladenosine dehydratase [Zoogloeaceae bacterium]
MTGKAPDADIERRFGGVRRLYGETAARRIAKARVCVAGIGGVGSWTVEALARSGIGALTLIDLDMVAESNTNRQIHALGNEYGKAKVDVMAARVAAIHPDCQITPVETFVTLENVASLLANTPDCVVDAVDDARVKAAMIAHCRRKGIPIVTAGAAGGQKDPTRIRQDDLARVTQDPLLARTRALLRREYGFPAGAPRKASEKFGIPAIFSMEPLRYPDRCAPNSETIGTPGIQGLSCAGFGSSVCVTATFGLAAAAAALERVCLVRQ